MVRGRMPEAAGQVPEYASVGMPPSLEAASPLPSYASQG